MILSSLREIALIRCDPPRWCYPIYSVKSIAPNQFAISVAALADFCRSLSISECQTFLKSTARMLLHRIGLSTNYLAVDLAMALPDLDREFELAICLEVAEHLEPLIALDR